MKTLLLTIFIVGAIINPFLSFGYSFIPTKVINMQNVDNEKNKWYDGKTFDIVVANGRYYMDYNSIYLYNIKELGNE